MFTWKLKKCTFRGEKRSIKQAIFAKNKSMCSIFHCLGLTKGSAQAQGTCSCFVTKQRFYGEEFLALRPTPKLEDHPLSAVLDCSFYIFACTVRIGGRSSIRKLRTSRAVVTGTHLLQQEFKKNGEKCKLWVFKIFRTLQQTADTNIRRLRCAKFYHFVAQIYANVYFIWNIANSTQWRQRKKFYGLKY